MAANGTCYGAKTVAVSCEVTFEESWRALSLADEIRDGVSCWLRDGSKYSPRASPESEADSIQAYAVSGSFVVPRPSEYR